MAERRRRVGPRHARRRTPQPRPRRLVERPVQILASARRTECRGEPARSQRAGETPSVSASARGRSRDPARGPVARPGGRRPAAHRAVHRRPDAHGRRGGGESAGALRRRSGHRQDLPRRAAGPALGRGRLAGRPGLPLPLAEAPSGLTALDAGADGLADRRRAPRLPPGRTGTLRCADRRRRAGPVRDGLHRNFGWRSGRWTGSGALVLVPRPEQPVADPALRPAREGAPGIARPRADAAANQLPQHPDHPGMDPRTPSAPTSASTGPEPVPPSAGNTRPPGANPPSGLPARSPSWWTREGSPPAR